MPRLTANRAFRYASRELSADEEFEADSKDVLVLTRLNNPLARSAGAGTEDQSATSDPLDQPRPSKRYSRRDMRAKE